MSVRIVYPGVPEEVARKLRSLCGPKEFPQVYPGAYEDVARKLKSLCGPGEFPQV